MSCVELMSQWSFLIFTLWGSLFLLQTTVLLHRLWLRPRWLQWALRAQGLRGKPYRLLTTVDGPSGCRKTSMPLRCHDIAPFVVPLLHNAVQEHGRTCLSSWFGPMPKVTVVDARLTREVMSGKSGHLEKFRRFPMLSRLLAAGLPTYEGEKWARHRRIISPAFHLEKLKIMLPAFYSCCQDLIARWTESLCNSEGWGEIDVYPEFQSLAVDAISCTAFGSSYLEGKRILELQAEQADRVSAGVKTIFIPGYLYLPTKNNRRMRQIDNEIESILQGIIGRRMQAMREGKLMKDDLLGLMLESNMREPDVVNGRSARGMSIEEVMEECKMFYFAGIGVPSTLLTWTIVLLSMHPEWQDRAREEVLAQFGKNQPDYDGLSSLRTVTMILYEVLRLYPPAIAFIRKTCKETTIGGIRYPAGVVIEMPVLLIHHDPDIWGEDVHEFRPERFAEGISKASNDPGVFLPFGWGPRACIGKNFALLEAKMAVCMILQHFEFELAPTYIHAPHNKTLHPMHGAHINLRALV